MIKFFPLSARTVSLNREDDIPKTIRLSTIVRQLLRRSDYRYDFLSVSDLIFQVLTCNSELVSGLLNRRYIYTHVHIHVRIIYACLCGEHGHPWRLGARG